MDNANGPDFSHWDGQVDFDALMASGAEFAWFKIGQGYRQDSQWPRNQTEATARGLHHGGYPYYDNTVPPLVQAYKVLEWIQGRSLPLGVAWDFEDRTSGSYKGWRHLAVAMGKVKELAPGLRMLVYTSPSYWQEFGPSRFWNFSSWRWFAQFPLWVANYGVSTPKVPGPWINWTFWQYAVNGDPKKYGSQKLACDLNFYNGDAYALDRFVLEGGQPPVPVPPPSTYTGTVVAPAGVNVRDGHSAAATKIGALPMGTAVRGDATWVLNSAEKWLHITSPAPAGWIATIYGGQTLVRMA
jgi:lysozyme